MAQLPWMANTDGNTEGMTDFSPLPSGKYNAQIVKSEYKETKKKDGHYLSLQLKILDGTYKDRVLFENLNLDNPNPVAVEIANKALNSICQACGAVGVEDSEELHGIPMMIKVRLKPKTATQPPSNDILFYEEYTGEIIEENDETGEKPVAKAPPFATKAAAKPAAKPVVKAKAKAAAKPAAKPAAKKLPWEK